MYIWVKPKPHTHTHTHARTHTHTILVEVPSSAPHLLHKGLLVSPIKWGCLLRVLCPVRRPITAADCVLLKEKNLAFLIALGPEISFRSCLWVLLRSRHIIKWQLSTQLYIFLFIFCLETPKDVCGPTNFWTEPSLQACRRFHFLVTQHVQ